MRYQLKIGELAKKIGCLVETIRYYEKQGLLLKPGRSAGNFRLYDKTHIERLKFIRHCRLLDMTLDEIRMLLKFRDNPEANCHDVNNLLGEHIRHIADRINELKGLEKHLKALYSQCQQTKTTKDCGILQSLTNLPRDIANVSRGESHHTHLHKTHRK